MVYTGYLDDSHLVQGEHNEFDGDDIDDYYDPHPEPMTFQEWTDWCVVVTESARALRARPSRGD
jgi:hypothetical protein